MVEAPLDVVCQQLVAMACAGECSVDEAFTMIRKAGPMAGLSRADFDACLDFLAGDLAAPARRVRARAGRGAALVVSPDLEAQRLVRHPRPPRGPLVLEQRGDDHLGGERPGSGGRGGDRHGRRGLRRAAQPGRPVRARRPIARIPPPRRVDHPCPCRRGEPGLPIWHSDRQSLSSELACEVAEFRAEGAGG